MTKNTLKYNAIALFTVVVWAVTFISTKVLMFNGLSPVEIFITRFSIAYFCAFLFSYKRLWAENWKDEMMLLAAGITGGSLYFITENTALGITFTSNVALLLCCAPIFTMILGKLLFNDFISIRAWIGSLIAFAGVGVVVFNGAAHYGINPLGDCLTLAAALSWAAYCMLLKRLNRKYTNMFINRKVFAYGVITAALFYIATPDNTTINLNEIQSIVFNMLFLSVGASFICYLTWNTAVKHLGAEKAANYIYLVPLISIVAATLILNEPISVWIAVGAILIIGGLVMTTKTQ